MESGSLRHRVTIEKPCAVTSNLGAGAAGFTWTIVGEVWARVRPLRALEVLRAQQIQQETTHVINMRYTAWITPGCRIGFKSQHLQIQSIIDVNNRGTELEIMAIERGEAFQWPTA